ncbi:MAG: molybdenum cofactor biosynthesis protein B [Candidatus Binataceae bacterium]
MSVHDHKHRPSRPLKAGVITVSDSRTEQTDTSGKLIRDLLQQAGHEVAYHEIMPDEPRLIAEAVVAHRSGLDVIVINGGTGISPRDQTYEAVKGLLDKELDGFGELFRMLSYQEIGSAAFLSRAVAGISAGKILVSLPGSTAACRLGLEKLLLPELGHMANQLGLV